MKKSALVITILFMSGCNKPTRTQDEPLPIHYTLASQDGDLTIPKRMNLAPLTGSVKTATVMEHIDSLHKSGDSVAASIYLKLVSTPLLSTTVSFRRSPYVEFFIAKSQSDFFSATNDLPQMFAQQLTVLDKTIAKSKAEFSFPQTELTTSQALLEIAKFLNVFEANLLASSLNESVKTAVTGQLYRRFWAKLGDARSMAQHLESAPDLKSGIEYLRRLLGQLGVELDREKESELRSAQELGEKLNSEMSERDIFDLLIEIWDRMNDEERKTTFGDVSPELYKFLSSENRQQLFCLKLPPCVAMIHRLAKEVFILPNIKTYGVSKLQTQIKQAAVDNLKAKTNRMATDLVSEMPDILRTSISNEMESEKKRFEGYRRNYPDFIRRELQTWFESRFDQSRISALDADRLVIESGVFSATRAEGGIEISSDALGAGLSAAAPILTNRALWPEKKSTLELMTLSRINQVLAYGGFTLADGSPFPSLTRSFIGNQLLAYNVEASLNFPGLFSMPSPLRIQRGFQVPESAPIRNLNPMSEARLLRGFSAMALAFKEGSAYQHILGQIKAAEMIKSLPADSLQFSAFPDDGMMAVSVGNASAVLSNLLAKGTPLFVLCHEPAIAWGDQKSGCKKPAARAGLVSVDRGNRQFTLDLEAQAEYLDALLTFLELADTIKDSRSPYLNRRSGDQPSGLEQLNQALPKLKGLGLAMSNMISTVFESSKGRFSAQYNLQTHTKSSQLASAPVSLKAIRALAHAAQYYRYKGYGISAVSAYYALNREMWNDSSGFYDLGTTKVGPHHVSLALEALRPLTNWISDSSSLEQHNKLMELWRRALKQTSI